MPTINPTPDAGLCADCTHAQVVTSSKGSVFYLCRLWTTGRYAKYPVLPVLRCEGFERLR